MARGTDGWQCGRGTAFLVAAFLAPTAIPGQPAGRAIRSVEPGWPQFRGPRRDGICTETGLLQTWPSRGPRLVWTTSGLGRGYSSPIITRGAIYVTGDVGNDLAIFALDLAGKLKWRATNGRAWRRSWPGARATCTYAGGRLYDMNAHGRVACLDAADGKELWAVDVLRRFQGRNIQWGLSECLLTDGERVIVTPGGRKALMVALDKHTGQTVWATEPLRFLRTERFPGRRVDPPVPDTDCAGYAAPILFELGGRRLIAGASGRHVFCVDADAGKLLWTHLVPARWEVIGAIPVFWRDSVFFTAPDDFGGSLFRVHASREAVRFHQLWKTPVDNCHGAFVLVDGRLYGSGHRQFRPWACVDAATGRMLYSRRDLAKGSVIYADGRLYVLSEDATMSLLRPTPQGFETAGQFRLARGRRRDAWAHPAICDGRLYLRYHDTLYCYDIRRH